MPRRRGPPGPPTGRAVTVLRSDTPARGSKGRTCTTECPPSACSPGAAGPHRLTGLPPKWMGPSRWRTLKPNSRRTPRVDWKLPGPGRLPALRLATPLADTASRRAHPHRHSGPYEGPSGASFGRQGRDLGLLMPLATVLRSAYASFAQQANRFFSLASKRLSRRGARDPRRAATPSLWGTQPR
jgi:hypothetical protein